MPIYEFYCQKCNAKTSIFVKSMTESPNVQCSTCGSGDLERVISMFAYHKSMATIHEESGEPTAFPDMRYYKDPRNIGRWAEKKFREVGMDIPAELQEEIHAARDGEIPTQVKKQL